MLTIEMLPAAQGDCLWIEYGKGKDIRRVIIDGGTPGTYKKALHDRIADLPADQRAFELLVVTHIDSDHIGGVLPLVADTDLGATYGDVWFNGFKHLVKPDELGPKQGDLLTDAIEEQKLPWNSAFDGKAVVVPDEGDLPVFVLAGGLTLTLLSPTREKLADLREVWEKATGGAGLVPGVEPKPDEAELEVSGPADILGDEINVAALAGKAFEPDDTAPNGSSIALLLEYEGKRILLAGDAHAPVLVDSIERLLGKKGAKLRLDAIKLPHHGSRRNVSKDLVAAVETRAYLFSTSGAIYKHPDRVAVARILEFGAEQPTLFFNYRSEFTEVWDKKALKDHNHYGAEYPEPGAEGLRVEL